MEQDTYRAFMNWSGGKDSALALYHCRQGGTYQIEKLLTNITANDRRVSMHSVHEKLLDQQAACLGIPLQKMVLPGQPSNNQFQIITRQAFSQLKNEGFTHAVYGDIFLEDLKLYREDLLGDTGLKPVFPLWKMDSTQLVNDFIELGFKAVVVCVNVQSLAKDFVGRIIDHQFLNDLPLGVDPCGENGEYHSFVFDGPIFHQPVLFNRGDVTFQQLNAPSNSAENSGDNNKLKKMGFYYADLLPVN